MVGRGQGWKGCESVTGRCRRNLSPKLGFPPPGFERGGGPTRRQPRSATELVASLSWPSAEARIRDKLARPRRARYGGVRVPWASGSRPPSTFRRIRIVATDTPRPGGPAEPSQVFVTCSVLSRHAGSSRAYRGQVGR